MDKYQKDISMEPKKTEKLVSALYLITGFFDDKETMKWSLRELGGKLISQRGNRNVAVEIMGLLNVAKNAGLISDMNHEIIYREFSALVTSNPTLNELFKNGENERAEISSESTKSLPEKVDDNNPYVASSVLSLKDKTPREPVRPKEYEKEGVVAEKRNGRQTVIINLLKKKKEIMIKDVSSLIEGVSEKTIQRELLAMVSSGILRKVGEKRWSRYSLADQA
jgi:hypothetical protein